MRNRKWWHLPVGLIVAAVWLEVFLRWPLEGIVVLLAAGGWWDYQRRRAKLNPPWE